MTWRKIVSIAFFLGAVGGCAAVGHWHFSELYGKPEPRNREVAVLEAGRVDYWSEAKPIIEKRCVVCHGCYDAPCQLQLGSIEGIERGASKEKVYRASRLTPAEPTRLFQDAVSVEAWREKGFFPALSEYPNTLDANRNASLIYNFLELKQQHPLPQTKHLPTGIDIRLDRNDQCPIVENFELYASGSPFGGMPYGLPGLTNSEHETLVGWIEEGATHTPRKPLPSDYLAGQAEWEKFLNRDDLKSRLMSRYLYEHLFLANLYFSDLPLGVFFKLVRSETPPGEPVSIIATRRPYDDPQVERVYYRLVRKVSTTLVKTHMPYALNPKRMAKWTRWFLEHRDKVASLPSYDEAVASNPFLTFRDVPVGSRYKFLLDEAQFTIMNFIKGPVCRGQTALNVIRDQFWVFFVDPKLSGTPEHDRELAALSESLQLPTSTDVSPIEIFTQWERYSELHRKYLAGKAHFLESEFGGKAKIDLDLIWDGDGDNPNAALTVFRNFDSATVEKGLVGGKPKTAWVLGYESLERIHYLLVAGFDVYGNVGHQLLARIYMDFLRMEGESNFLLFMPPKARVRERDDWYRGAHAVVTKYMKLIENEELLVPAIDFQTEDPKSELFDLLETRLAGITPEDMKLASLSDDRLRETLEPLDGLTGGAVQFLSQVSLLEISNGGERHYLSLVRVNAHLNMATLFREESNREPEKDSLSVLLGFSGAYPNTLLRVPYRLVGSFVSQVRSLDSDKDYEAVMDTFGVRRTDPSFWTHSDQVHADMKKAMPVHAGLLDFSRLKDQ